MYLLNPLCPEAPLDSISLQFQSDKFLYILNKEIVQNLKIEPSQTEE